MRAIPRDQQTPQQGTQEQTPLDVALPGPYQPRVVASPHYVWLAILLSVLIIGAGQIYNRQVTKGILILIVTIVGVPMILIGMTWIRMLSGHPITGFLLNPFLLGLVMCFLIWVVNIIDAALIGRKIAGSRQIATLEWF